MSHDDNDYWDKCVDSMAVAQVDAVALLPRYEPEWVCPKCLEPCRVLPVYKPPHGIRLHSSKTVIPSHCGWMKYKCSNCGFTMSTQTADTRKVEK